LIVKQLPEVLGQNLNLANFITLVHKIRLFYVRSLQVQRLVQKESIPILAQTLTEQLSIEPDFLMLAIGLLLLTIQ
jgi:hypothetical protein